MKEQALLSAPGSFSLMERGSTTLFEPRKFNNDSALGLLSEYDKYLLVEQQANSPCFMKLFVLRDD